MSKLALCTSLLIIFIGTWLPDARAGTIELTQEERDWIKAHPELRVGVLERLIPFEYMSDGELRGLSPHYLNFVTRTTGLQFTFESAATTTDLINLLLARQVDLLSSNLRHRGIRAPNILVVPPYHTSTPIIVTRVDSSWVYNFEQLQGKTVVVPYVDYYETMFRERGINVKLIKSRSALEMLTLVKGGSADAAIASATFLMPYLYRQFQGILQTAGVIGEQRLEVGLAVNMDQQVLHSILKKALSSITPEQRRTIYQQWYRELEVDVPSISSITHHYSHILIFVTLILIGLFALLYRSHIQRRRAVASEEEKTLFLAVMRHEIRSPMNAVLAAMELLLHTQLNVQQRHFAQLANSGANTLLRLLNEVLLIPRLEAGRLHLNVEPTSVTLLIQGVVGLHRLRAREKQLELNQTIEAALPMLMLDSVRLSQIVHNLISNAIKFTDIGHVDIDLRLVAVEPDIQHLQIEVRDTGIGISNEVQASLFKPYAQASQSYKKSGGTGLGLVISQQLVSLMNGSLSLSSEPGMGTCVTIRLPITLAQAEHWLVVDEAESMGTISADTFDLQVLVVEDTLVNQEVLRAQINGFGCRSIVAADAARARALFQEHCYDLVLMDCDLPDQDGYSLVRELRELESQLRPSRCPIIAISALTGEQHREQCFAAGMDGVLSKPIGMGALREVIELWCNVTLSPPNTRLMASELNKTAINREMSWDLGNLIRAMAVSDRHSALHAVHRLHGVALFMDGAALAKAGEDLENLLRSDASWDDPGYVHTLTSLIQHWHTFSCGQPIEVLPVARSSTSVPL